MSHAFNYPDSEQPDQEWSVYHNGDFSGYVSISPPGADYAMDIPFDLLCEIVGRKIQQSRIEKIEQTTGESTVWELLR